jgi:hypothetical protein
MLEASIKRILKERRWLFRGTSEVAFERRDGLYFGVHTFEGVSTSVTLSAMYAMSYAVREGEKRECKPVFLAIDGKPYVDNIKKGVEWHPFRTWNGIVLPDEYEIVVPVRQRHLHVIDSVDEFREYVGDVSDYVFGRLCRKFDELTSPPSQSVGHVASSARYAPRQKVEYHKRRRNRAST